MRRTRPWALALLCLLAATSLGASCGTRAITVLPGVVNDPGNLSLRRSLLAYGTEHMCTELGRHGLPVKLRDEDPAIGRYFVTTCDIQTLADDALLVQFEGYGYGWSELTHRVGFQAGGAVTFEPDFLVEGGSMYVYLRPRSTSASRVDVRMVEKPGALALGTFLGGSSFGNDLATAVFRGELARGFTVVREAEGQVSFGLGIVEKGRRPSAPFELRAQDQLVQANERVELRPEQRDFAGPFQVRAEESVWLVASLEGAESVDLLLLPRAQAELWRDEALRAPLLGSQPVAAPYSEVLQAGRPIERRLRLTPGEYFLVLDHSTSAGVARPTAAVPSGSGAGVVSFALSTSEAP